MSNPEPVFAARAARVAYPPKILKDKHVKLRLCAPPDPAAAAKYVRGLDALGWRLAEQVQTAQILANDVVDIAFTLEMNDHPEFGGLELRLEDIVRAVPVQNTVAASTSA
jgi:single-stranded-DNA-specific exonuclease